MADAALFDAVADALEGASGMDSLATRGTLRLALKSAGLDPKRVTPAQMRVVLERVLPNELERRGVPDGQGVCEGVARSLDRVAAGAGAPERSAPEDIFRRMRE